MPTKSEIIEKLARAIYNNDRYVIDGIFNGQLQRNVLLDFEQFEKQMPKEAADNRNAATACFNTLSEYVTFLEEGSEPRKGDIVLTKSGFFRQVTEVDGQFYKGVGGGWRDVGFDPIAVIKSDGKPVITLQKE